MLDSLSASKRANVFEKENCDIGNISIVNYCSGNKWNSADHGREKFQRAPLILQFHKTDVVKFVIVTVGFKKLLFRWPF